MQRANNNNDSTPIHIFRHRGVEDNSKTTLMNLEDVEAACRKIPCPSAAAQRAAMGPQPTKIWCEWR